MRWAWMLPMAELLIAATVAGPRLIDEYQMGRLLRDPSWLRVMSHLDLRPLPQSAQASKQSWIGAISENLPERTQCVVLANIPGAAVDFLVASVRDKPTVELTRAFPFDRWAWGAILYPIFALPFWWVLGRSADAAQLLTSANSKRLRWWDLALMLPIAVGAVAIGIDYLAFSTPDDLANTDFRRVVIAIVIWGTAGTAATVIWFLQRRKHRLRSGPASV